jgi:hypothetical protein
MRRLIAVLLLVSFGSVGQAGQIGDDGMYKESWMRDTFKDLREDLAEANAEGNDWLLSSSSAAAFIAKKCMRKFLCSLACLLTSRKTFSSYN